MNQLNTGALVRLKKGSQVMEVIMKSTQRTNTYICGWFSGDEYIQHDYPEQELMWER